MKKTILMTFLCLLLTLAVSAQTTSDDKSDNNSKAKMETKNDKEKKPRKEAFRPVKAQITEAQTKLKASGMYSGDADGRYNDDFRDAIKKYQEANGLDKTGKLDEETLVKIGIELTDKQKGIETAESSKASARTSFRPTKEQIEEAQTKLKAAGLYNGESDGKYNNDLRTAVRNYQTANGLKRKGSLNRATLEKMKIELTESQMEIPVNPNDLASEKSDNADKPKRTIFRATKEQIMEVQKMLKTAGLYNGEETGKLNPATRSAIREWQAQNNVNKTGTLNKETLEAMKVELTDKQKEM